MSEPRLDEPTVALTLSDLEALLRTIKQQPQETPLPPTRALEIAIDEQNIKVILLYIHISFSPASSSPGVTKSLPLHFR